MKKVLLIFLIGISYCIYAQHSGPFVSFDELVYDFGTFKEEDGPVTYKFMFTNTGASPLIIQDVKASCGCTTPEWTTEPVLPGEKGFISATYNPKNRPGKFNKSITVTTNSLEPVIRLTITGEVLLKQQTNEDIYKINMDGVRFITHTLGFGRIYKEEMSTKEIEILNTLNANAILTFANVPAYLTITVVPAVIIPNEKGIVKVTYDASKNNTWGHSYTRVNVFINGKQVTNNHLTISASIEEDFSHLTPEELENAAHIEFKNTTYNFGTISQNNMVEHLFEFTNTGKSDLIIRLVKASCGCTAVKPEKSILKPDETSTIKVIFNPRGRKGSQSKSITVITNDPVKTMHILYLKGNIEVTDNSK